MQKVGITIFLKTLDCFLGCFKLLQWKVAPGIDLNYSKNASINIWVPKMCFSKMYIFGPQLNQRGMVYSIFLIRQKPELRAGLIRYKNIRHCPTVHHTYIPTCILYTCRCIICIYISSIVLT